MNCYLPEALVELQAYIHVQEDTVHFTLPIYPFTIVDIIHLHVHVDLYSRFYMYICSCEFLDVLHMELKPGILYMYM